MYPQSCTLILRRCTNVDPVCGCNCIADCFTPNFLTIALLTGTLWRSYTTCSRVDLLTRDDLFTDTPFIPAHINHNTVTLRKAVFMLGQRRRFRLSVPWLLGIILRVPVRIYEDFHHKKIYLQLCAKSDVAAIRLRLIEFVQWHFPLIKYGEYGWYSLM